MLNKAKNVQYDDRLTLPLDFVCKIRGITKETFTTLALADLLYEELDFIKHNYNTESFPHNDSAEIDNHTKTVKDVKSEADSWILNSTL